MKLFIFDHCVSSSLHAGFSLVAANGLLSICRAEASPCGGFSCGARALGGRAQ